MFLGFRPLRIVSSLTRSMREASNHQKKRGRRIKSGAEIIALANKPHGSIPDAYQGNRTKQYVRRQKGQMSLEEMERMDRKLREDRERHKEEAKGSVYYNWRKMKSLPQYLKNRFAIKEKFGAEGWRPKRVVRYEVRNSMKFLKEYYPDMPISELSAKFDVDPESVRRILRSKWVRSDEEEADRIRRASKKKQSTNGGLLKKYITQQLINGKYIDHDVVADMKRRGKYEKGYVEPYFN